MSSPNSPSGATRARWIPAHALACWFLALCAIAVACVSDRSRRPPPDAGKPAAFLVLPGAGQAAPTNLATVVVGATTILAPGGSIELLDESGGTIATRAVASPLCDARPTGMCLAVTPGEPLPPGRDITVRARLVAADGGPVGAEGLWFRSADAPDVTAPVVSALSVVTDGACAVVHARSDEPAVLEAWVAEGTRSAEPRLVFDHTVTLPLARAGLLSMAVTDAAGNGARPEPVAVAPSALPLVVTEVLPNPRGAEPAEEWIELQNVGGEARSTLGLALEIDDTRVALPAETLGPGGFALVVSAAFSGAGPDPAPPPDAILLRLPTARIGPGLTNRRTRIALLDPAGRLVSSYGGWLDLSPDSLEGRSARRVGVCDVAASWAPGWPPTPGR